MKALMLEHIHRLVGTATFMVGEDDVRSRPALEKIGSAPRNDDEVRMMAGEPRRHGTSAMARSAA